MKSLQLLDQLKEVPLAGVHSPLQTSEMLAKFAAMRADMAGVEATVATEAVLSYIFEDRNVPDQLFSAYQTAWPNISESQSLHERYLEVAKGGPEAAAQFVTNLKSKLAEIKIAESLQKQFPGYEFTLSPNQNEAVWDIVGRSLEGKEDILVQVKCGGEAYASSVVASMDASPEVQFAVSREIYQKISEMRPDLVPQIIHNDISNIDLTEATEADIQTLAENMGIDVPDAVGDVLPYATEIILGVRFLLDVAKNKKEMPDIPTGDRRRVNAMRALVLLQKFGVSTVFTVIGGAAGTFFFPPVGNIGGAILGAYLASEFNKFIAPHSQEIALEIAGLKPDDILYFKNKAALDSLGFSFVQSRKALCH
jgi:hypothetical protein